MKFGRSSRVRNPIGWAATKPDVARRISSTIGSIRAGSRPQFAPRMSAPSPARMRVASASGTPSAVSVSRTVNVIIAGKPAA